MYIFPIVQSTAFTANYKPAFEAACNLHLRNKSIFCVETSKHLYKHGLKVTEGVH